MKNLELQHVNEMASFNFNQYHWVVLLGMVCMVPSKTGAPPHPPSPYLLGGDELYPNSRKKALAIIVRITQT